MDRGDIIPVTLRVFVAAIWLRYSLVGLLEGS